MIRNIQAADHAGIVQLTCLSFSLFFLYDAISNAQDATVPAGRKVVDFNSGWRFTKGDPAGAEKVDFQEGATPWTDVRLPHDWAIAGPFNPDENGFAAKLPWQGVGWYRKSFNVGEFLRNSRSESSLGETRLRYDLDFDGVMALPKIYVTGELAGEWDYGYTPFQIDITKFVKFGEPNVVAVRVDTTKHGTRWYPGAGIYRGVKLTVCNPVHIAHWSTFVTTPEVSDESASVIVRTTIENHTSIQP